MDLHLSAGRRRLVGLALLLTVGCASSHSAAPITDLELVTLALDYVEDVKSNPKFLAQRFAAGAVPPAAELRRYAQYSYKAAGRPAAGGDTATLPVQVLGAGGREAGQVEWTFVKEGNAWKLQKAPLP
jgi:hypothetical protein